MKASSTKQWVPVKTGRGESLVELQPGQFLFGRKQASKELRTAGVTVADRLAKLEKLGNIVIQPVTHYSVVTICNWETYQRNYNEVPSGNPSGNRQPTVNQPSTNRHIQECKESKEEVSALPHSPEWLKHEEVANAFRRWFKYLAGRGKAPFDEPLALISAARMFDCGTDAVFAIDQAIGGGWFNLRPECGKPKPAEGFKSSSDPSKNIPKPRYL
jgi:hypothetical protein